MRYVLAITGALLQSFITNYLFQVLFEYFTQSLFEVCVFVLNNEIEIPFAIDAISDSSNFWDNYSSPFQKK